MKYYIKLKSNYIFNPEQVTASLKFLVEMVRTTVPDIDLYSYYTIAIVHVIVHNYVLRNLFKKG